MEIFINGQRYDSIDDVPPQLRGLIADADGDGLPDAFEDLIAQARSSQSPGEASTTLVQTATFTVDGEPVSADRLPAAAREALTALTGLGAATAPADPAPTDPAVPPAGHPTLLNGVPMEEPRSAPWWKFWA